MNRGARCFCWEPSRRCGSGSTARRAAFHGGGGVSLAGDFDRVFRPISLACVAQTIVMGSPSSSTTTTWTEL